MPVNWAWSFEQTLHGSQRGFTIGTILAIFDLRVIPMLPTKFRVNWPFGSGEEAKNRFSRWLPWRPSWISDWHDFSYFWYKSPQCLLRSLKSIGLSVQYRFSRWRPWWPSGISDQNDFSYICSTSHLMLPTKFRVKWLLGLGEEAKIDFLDSRHGGHLRFTIGMILAMFDLQVTQMHPTKFRVNWPFGSGLRGEKYIFSRWLPWRPSWISDRHDLSYFWSISHPNASYQVWSQLAFRLRRRSEK